MNVKLTKAQKIRILNAQSIYDIMREVLLRENSIDRNKEHLWLVCLSASNRLLMIELVSLGSVHSTIVEPMDIFSFALQKRAVKLILVHNHPSGELEPSPPDIEITERMYAIGKFVRVPVIDHLVISTQGYYSFDEQGLIQKMDTEKRYDLSLKEQDKLLTEMKRITLEKEVAEKERNIALRENKQKDEKIKEMAKLLLQQGTSIAAIVKVTGLKKKEVEALKKA